MLSVACLTMGRPAKPGTTHAHVFECGYMVAARSCCHELVTRDRIVRTLQRPQLHATLYTCERTSNQTTRGARVRVFESLQPSAIACP